MQLIIMQSSTSPAIYPLKANVERRAICDSPRILDLCRHEPITHAAQSVGNQIWPFAGEHAGISSLPANEVEVIGMQAEGILNHPAHPIASALLHRIICP